MIFLQGEKRSPGLWQRARPTKSRQVRRSWLSWNRKLINTDFLDLMSTLQCNLKSVANAVTNAVKKQAQDPEMNRKDDA